MNGERLRRRREDREPTVIARNGKMIEWMNIPKECPEELKRELLRAITSFFLRMEDATATPEDRQVRQGFRRL